MNTLRLFCAAAALLMAARQLPAAEPGAELNKDAMYEEVDPIGYGKEKLFKELSAVALTADGKLLAADTVARSITVFDAQGKVAETWKVDASPTELCVASDGCVYVGAREKLVKLDKTGKVLKTVEPDGKNYPKAPIAGLAVSGKDVFVAFAYTASALRGQVVRFDADLANPTVVASKLAGCCGNLDIAVYDGKLYVAENSGHHVLVYDREGKKLSEWGKMSRDDVEGFGGCCNPMGICFGDDGAVYTCEKTPNRIKRYTADGKYEGLAGYVGLKPLPDTKQIPSCITSHLVASKDGSRLYTIDYVNGIIRVLARKA